jgi:hypothetical protein
MILADAVWSAYAAVTPVIASPARPTLVRVRIPAATIGPGADGDYPDVRVVDESGREIPYAIDPQQKASPMRAVALIDLGFVPHAATQAVADLGASAALVDAITLVIDEARRPTYFERVAVDAGDDRKTWRIVVTDALIYRVAQDNGKGNQTVSFSPTRSRWLRIRVLNPHAPFPLTGASVGNAVPAEAFADLPIAARPDPSAAPATQAWTFSGSVALRPAAVSFGAASTTFSRAVLVQSSDDAKTWSPVGDGTIARYADHTAALSFAFSEQTAAHIRVVVQNGNDAALPIAPHLLAVPHDIVFEAVPRHQYRILSSNAAATKPVYDLGARLAHQKWSAALAAIEPTRPNPDFRDARPVTERYPWLLTAAIAAMAIVLGFFALRTIRKADQGA